MNTGEEVRKRVARRFCGNLQVGYSGPVPILVEKGMAYSPESH
jgi:hypothetical protein